MRELKDNETEGWVPAIAARSAGMRDSRIRILWVPAVVGRTRRMSNIPSGGGGGTSPLTTRGGDYSLWWWTGASSMAR